MLEKTCRYDAMECPPTDHLTIHLFDVLQIFYIHLYFDSCEHQLIYTSV